MFNFVYHQMQFTFYFIDSLAKIIILSCFVFSHPRAGSSLFAALGHVEVLPLFSRNTSEKMQKKKIKNCDAPLKFGALSIWPTSPLPRAGPAL